MQLVQENQSKSIPTLAIGSGKGGVGKSTFTVLLAHILKQLSFKVGIVDADLYGPSLSLMLPPESVLTVDDAGTIFPAISQDIKIVSASHFAQGQRATIVRAPIANAMIQTFATQVNWGDTDIVLIDLPPGTGDIQLTLLQTIPLNGALAVTTPSKVALIDVKKSIEMFRQMNVPIWGLVENMSFFQDALTGEKSFPFGMGGGKALAEEMGVPFLQNIPLDEMVSQSLDQGISPFSLRKETYVERIMVEIAIEISEQMCDDGDCSNRLEKVEQIDNKNFEVTRGGRRYRLNFAKVQQVCPCARCSKGREEKSEADDNAVIKDVTATSIEIVGRYALRFMFTSGCSRGIYSWCHLENFGVVLSLSS